jgi:hypothetical protein
MDILIRVSTGHSQTEQTRSSTIPHSGLIKMAMDTATIPRVPTPIPVQVRLEHPLETGTVASTVTMTHIQTLKQTSGDGPSSKELMVVRMSLVHRAMIETVAPMMMAMATPTPTRQGPMVLCGG